jgi:hypothetical protein
MVAAGRGSGARLVAERAAARRRLVQRPDTRRRELVAAYPARSTDATLSASVWRLSRRSSSFSTL